ncbi:oligosaccharide flippase family protein [Kaistia sp. 32K]|uniref:lipopolysaccharide biosynthesis protein n=1 Tax=Kaistia sp. 32K TaxID=2795690 RepID=UPI0019159278
MRTRLFNIGHLLTGNLFGSLIGMLAFVVTARALGPTDYGILALTYSYTRAVERLVSFQSWQPLIKYGAELQGPEHRDDYRSLLKFGLFVDMSAATMAYLVSIGLALLFGPLLGIGDAALKQVLIYSTVLLFQINGLPTAVIRLAGRFRLVAYGTLVGGLVRLALCTIGLAMGADLLFFVIVWTVTQIVGALSLLFLAFVELRRQGVGDLLRAPLRGVTTRFKGLVSFTVGSNVELTVRSSANELDTLIVGMLADPTAAGLYHVAKRMGRLVLQLGVQVQAVLYPDVARLWARRALGEFRSTVLQMEILLIVFGLMLVALTFLGIRPLLYWTAGPQFAAAAPLAMVQMVAVAMLLSGGAVRTALLSMGRQPAVLKIVFVAAIAFQITAFSVIPLIGAMGANIAHVVMATVMLTGLIAVYRSALAKEALHPTIAAVDDSPGAPSGTVTARPA